MQRLDYKIMMFSPQSRDCFVPHVRLQRLKAKKMEFNLNTIKVSWRRFLEHKERLHHPLVDEGEKDAAMVADKVGDKETEQV